MHSNKTTKLSINIKIYVRDLQNMPYFMIILHPLKMFTGLPE